MNLKYGPYSPSRLETATCPYSFYRQYVDVETRVVRREGLPQARGAAVHMSFEAITEFMKTLKLTGKLGRRVDYPGVEALVATCIAEHPAAQPETAAILDMVHTYLNNPPMFLTEDAEVEKLLAVKPVEGTTGIYEPCDYQDMGAHVRGRADILSLSDDTTIGYLYDFKTQPNKEEADTFQLGVYAWLVSLHHPYLDEIRTVLYFARYGKYSPHVIWVKNHEIRERILAERPDIDQGHVISLTDLEDELYTRIQIAERMPEWEPIPHRGCQYCPVLSECPALKGLIEVQPDGKLFVKDNFRIMGDTSQAVKVAGYINVLENFISDMKDELKEHVKAGGPIAIPGKVYCFKTEEAVDWDKVNRSKNTLYGIYEKFGIDPRRHMGFSQTLSKGMMLEPNEEFVKEIREHLPIKLTSMFKGWKA